MCSVVFSMGLLLVSWLLTAVSFLVIVAVVAGIVLIVARGRREKTAENFHGSLSFL